MAAPEPQVARVTVLSPEFDRCVQGLPRRDEAGAVEPDGDLLPSVVVARSVIPGTHMEDLAFAEQMKKAPPVRLIYLFEEEVLMDSKRLIGVGDVMHPHR